MSRRLPCTRYPPSAVLTDASVCALVSPLAAVVATKSDKLKKQPLQASLETLCESLGLPEDQPIALSSATGNGKKEVWRRITDLATESLPRGREED